MWQLALALSSHPFGVSWIPKCDLGVFSRIPASIQLNAWDPSGSQIFNWIHSGIQLNTPESHSGIQLNTHSKNLQMTFKWMKWVFCCRTVEVRKLSFFLDHSSLPFALSFMCFQYFLVILDVAADVQYSRKLCLLVHFWFHHFSG